MILENINGSYIYYDDNQVIHIREYYNYCVNIFKQWLLDNNGKYNLIIGKYTYDFNNENRTSKIDIQCEHTLVIDGGRSVRNKIYGNVVYNDNQYLVRIDNFDYFSSLDLVIEYSLPNINNIYLSNQFNDYLRKNIYIPPLLYETNFDGLKTDIITLFDYTNNERRNNALMALKDLNIPNKTVTDCFSHESLLELYNRTKIMVNIHQTDHHHTFEELRVLPALLNGVIIISEDVPLKETIPYHEYIIWVKYDEIPRKTLEVMNNYEYYYNKLFTDGNLKLILEKMKFNNKTINNVII